jgi:hypothetical protein
LPPLFLGQNELIYIYTVQSNHMPNFSTPSAALAYAAQSYELSIDDLLAEFKVFLGHNDLTGAVELQVWEPTCAGGQTIYMGGAVCTVF